MDNKAYTICFWIFCAILALPLFLVPGLSNPPDWDKTVFFRCFMVVAIALFAWNVYKNRDFKDVKQKLKSIKVPFLILCSVFLWFLLATIFSQDFSFSLWGSPYRSGGVITFFFYLLFAVFGFLIIKKEDWHKLIKWSLFAGCLVGFVALFQNFSVFSNFLHPFEARPPSTTGNSIFLGIYSLMLFFVAVEVFLKSELKKQRILYGAISVFLFFIVLISGSRAAYLGLLTGTLYFLLSFPQENKKIKLVKIAGFALICLGFLFVIYVNITPKLPEFIQQNTVLNTVSGRLSFKLFKQEARFSAWDITWQAIKQKPVLGYGPENLQIGFDRYYDPSLPQMPQTWWDRAHNIFLDTAVSVGIPGLILYLLFFIYIFWHLHKRHAIQSAMLAYFTAMLLSFDSFVTYIIIFFLAGYSLNLIKKEDASDKKEGFKPERKNKFVFSLVLLLLFIFIFFFNILPYITGSNTSFAMRLLRQGKCQDSINLMEKTITAKNYAANYAKLKYAEALKECGSSAEIQTGLAYTKRAIEVLEEASLSRPKYTNIWVFLARFGNILLEREPNPEKRQELSRQIKDYVKKGLALSPERQELIIEQEKNFVLDKNYQSAISLAEECAKIYSGFGACYWFSGLANIYLGNQEEGTRQIQLARDAGYTSSMLQLADAYASQNNYAELEYIYGIMAHDYPENFNYRALHAFSSAQIGRYDKAKAEALEVIRLGPKEAGDEARAFIKSLPYPYNQLP